MNIQEQNALIIQRAQDRIKNPEPIIFTDDNGKVQCKISKFDVPFFLSLQSLPAALKIEMMKLTAEDWHEFIKGERERKLSHLYACLTAQWYWPETGDPISTTEQFIMNINLTWKELLQKTKKGTLSDEILNKAIEFFTSNECYTNGMI